MGICAQCLKEFKGAGVKDDGKTYCSAACAKVGKEEKKKNVCEFC